jgi:hypothetical protein
MSEQPNTQHNKEIDLLDVTGRIFSGIGIGIKNLFSWIKRVIQAFFRLAFKYWWILLIATILGGVFGHFKEKMTKPYFETEMLVETSVVGRVQIANRINNLQRMISDGNNSALAQQLSLPMSDVQHIFFIKADVVEIRVEGSVTRAEQPQFVRVRIRVWENEKIGRLEQAIVSFIENDAFIAEQTALVRQVNLSEQEAIELEIQQLTLFQRKNIEKSPQVMTAGNTPLMVQHEERTYTNEILELRSQLAQLRHNFELLRPIRIIQPFTPFENPVDKRMKNILFFAFLFFVAGYSALVIRAGWKRI